MRLAGVEGVVVHERQVEVKEALDKVLADKEIGIVLLTEKFGRDFPDLINRVRLEHNFPLLWKFPTVTAPAAKPDFITAYVNVRQSASSYNRNSTVKAEKQYWKAGGT